MNKEQIYSACIEKDLMLSYYNPLLDTLSKSQIKRVIEAIKNGDYTDLQIRLNKKTYYIEITPYCGVNDNEVDLVFLTKEQYSRYS